MQDLDYFDTLIAVADDCKTPTATVPQLRGGKKTAAVIQYELLADRPHELRSADVIFESWLRRQEHAADLSPQELEELRTEYFAKPQACLRSSPLAKAYGWGLLFDDDGRVALLPRDSPDYEHLVSGSDPGVTVVKALRSKRA